MRLERKKGEWLSENELAQGKRTDLVKELDQVKKPTLTDLNITKYESQVAQKIAAIPEEKLEKHIAENKTID